LSHACKRTVTLLLQVLIIVVLVSSSIFAAGPLTPTSPEYPSSDSAQVFASVLPTNTLAPPSGASGDLFGWSVAAYAGMVLVGSPCSDAGAEDAGAAYLFDAVAGSLSQTFTNPSPNVGDQFGLAISIAPDRILIGAPYDNLGANNAGTAYLFDSDNPSAMTTLQNPTPANGDLFGRSVAASQDYLAIGAPFDDSAFVDAGSVYLFNASTAGLIRALQSPNPSAGEYFGWTLAFAGDRVLVAAVGSDVGGPDAGAAYVFETATGSLLYTLQKPSPAAGDYFGWSVAATQSDFLVGAIGDDIGAVNSGGVYLFDTSGSLVRTFPNPAPGETDQFGLSVAVSGGSMVVGAPYDDTWAPDGGAAYLIDTASGSLLQAFGSPAPATQDYFGWSVAAFGNTIVVGAPYDNRKAPDDGAAYVFLVPTTWGAGGGGRIVKV